MKLSWCRFLHFGGMDEVDPLVFPQPVEARHRASLSEASSLTPKPLSTLNPETLKGPRQSQFGTPFKPLQGPPQKKSPKTSQPQSFGRRVEAAKAEEREREREEIDPNPPGTYYIGSKAPRALYSRYLGG